MAQTPTATSSTPTSASPHASYRSGQRRPVAIRMPPATNTAIECPSPQRSPNPAAERRAGRVLTNAVTAIMWSTSMAWARPRRNAVASATAGLTWMTPLRRMDE